MKFTRFIPLIILCVLALASATPAQSPIVTLQLGSDQIGVVKTSVGISTRITFPEPVAEIICGDLYNAADGKGTFVVARSGSDQKPGNDIYVKPVGAKGQSNMFVKTGDGKRTYNFDLNIVPPAQAHRVINVTDAAPNATSGGTDGARPGPCPDADRIRADAEEQGRRKADEILRNARQQADRITGEAEVRINEAHRQSTDRATQESDRRFVQALMLLREIRIANPKVTTKKKIIVSLEPSRVMLLGDKAYIRYTIQNAGAEDFTFNALTLETITGTETKPLTVEVVQNKSENRLTAGETLTGIVVFDPKQMDAKDKLAFYLRAEDHLEITHVTIQ